MNRIRTIQGAAAELHKRNPNCAITSHNIRQLMLHNEIPFRKAGFLYPIALDDAKHHFGLVIRHISSDVEIFGSN